MTCKVSGKTRILILCRFVTPKYIETIMGLDDSVVICNNYGNFVWKSVQCRDAHGYPAKIGGQLFAMYKSYNADSPKDVPLEGFNDNYYFSGHQQWKQEAQLPQRNSASAAHVYRGSLTDRAMYRTSQRLYYFLTFKRSASRSVGRKRILTSNSHSRSFILQQVTGR